MDVQFDETTVTKSRAAQTRHSWLTSLVLKTGLAGSEVGAQRVLLVVLVLLIGATVWFGSSLFDTQENLAPLAAPKR